MVLNMTGKIRHLLGIAGLTAIVIFAAVSTASAKLPEWGECTASHGGKYSDAGCIHRAHGKTGEYEWTPLEAERIVNGRPLTASGSIVFETQHGKRIECAEMSEDEESFDPIERYKDRTPLWEMTGCQSEGQECKTPFAQAEEITNTFAWGEEAAEEGQPAPGWTVTPGFIEGKGSEAPVVGMAYAPKNDERMFLPIECAGEIGTVWIGGQKKGHDTTIATISPVNTMSTEFTETFAQSAPGIQSPEALEHRKPVYLQAFLENHWERVAIQAELSYPLVKHQRIELKATP